MALAGTGKWEQLGAAMVRCAGPNLAKLQDGIQAGITAENARNGTSQTAAAKKRPAKKQAALIQNT